MGWSDNLGTAGLVRSKYAGLKLVSLQVTSLSIGFATHLTDESAIFIVHLQVIDHRRNLAEDCAAILELAHEHPLLRLLALFACVACVDLQDVVLREALDFAQLFAVVGSRFLVQEILKLVWVRQFADQAVLLVQHLDEDVVGLARANSSFRDEGIPAAAGLGVHLQNRWLYDRCKVQVVERER